MVGEVLGFEEDGEGCQCLRVKWTVVKEGEEPEGLVPVSLVRGYTLDELI